MAEQVILVCDVCGKPATASVTIAVQGGGARSGQRYAKDLCDADLATVVANARKPRRGRRRASVSSTEAAPAAPKRRGRPKKAATRSTAKRRGRPRSTGSASAAKAATAAPAVAG